MSQDDTSPDSNEGISYFSNATTGWAQPVGRLKSPSLPPEALNLNVEGRRITGPVQGFGQLWQKTYQARLNGSPATPKDIIRVWKARFPRFWPKGYRFYGPMEGIAPGSVAVLNLAGPGGAPLISTGVMVVYVSDLSFSFMTPEGHMFAGLITFSAWQESLAPVVQVQALIRANDPIYELSFWLRFGHRMEDNFWKATLRNLAAYFGVKAVVEQQVRCLDRRLQWRYARNIWQNAALRTWAYNFGLPYRRMRDALYRRRH